MRWLPAVTSIVLGCGGGCGGPILQNAPRPNPAVMAGAAAAVAGAATLADPDAAAHKQEQKKPDRQKPKDVRVDQTVPADVLDRLDQAETQGAAGPGSGAATPAREPAGAAPRTVKPKSSAAARKPKTAAPPTPAPAAPPPPPPR